MSSRRLFIGILSFLTLVSAYPAYRYCQFHRTQADVAIYGPIVMADGIGRQTAELADVLRKKHTVQIVSKNISKVDLPGWLKQMLKVKFSKPAKVAIVEDVLWSPGTGLNRFFNTTVPKDQIRIAYTMLESTQIMPEYVMMINLYFDAIVVPDPFFVDVYRKSGVTTPIFCIPLGLNLNDFLKTPLKRSERNGPMVFAILGSGNDRKNHKMAIEAFAKALGNNDDALLFINCRASDPLAKLSIQEEIKKQNCSNIKFTDFRLNKDAYLKFFSSVDCLISLSKGEGFSIQPREAMALGIPVILTDNTAQSTIAQSGLVKSVAADILEPCYYYNKPISDGYYFNCHLDEAVAAIQDVYIHYDQYADKAALMRAWASAYNFENLEPLYQTLVKPANVVLGDVDEVTSDCLTTTSKALYEKYRAL